MHWLPYSTSVILALLTLAITLSTIEHYYQTAHNSTTTIALNSNDEPAVKEKTIYLTFDDGPSIHTPKLLEILDRYNVKATFFVVGNNGSYSIIKDAYSRGHSIGLHTYSHKYKQIYASKEAYLADLEAIQDVVFKATGHKSYIIRFPGGSSNSISTPIKKGIMTELANMVTAKGYQYFDWNVDSNDGLGKLTRKEIANNVIAGIKKHNSSIVLQHDIWLESVYAVEDIIKWGLANGYSFAPLTMNSFAAHHTISN
ncbi:MAG: polysaccharide deacetylase [Lachnospira sp.]|nr:polysaccharide deacetylase [Lachnospira sp.]